MNTAMLIQEVKEMGWPLGDRDLSLIKDVAAILEQERQEEKDKIFKIFGDFCEAIRKQFEAKTVK
jgi:hypothetical protein